MFKYILSRVVTSIVTLWIVITVVFFMIRLLPGGPFTSERQMPPSVLANMKAKFGLDKPVSEQYAIYLKNLVQGNLGISIKTPGRTVNQYIEQGFPYSAKVGSIGIIVAVILGIVLGVVAALYHNKVPDRLVMILATLGYSIPSFVMGTLLIYFLVKIAGILPATFNKENPLTYIMPVIALSASGIATVTRLSRSKLIEVMQQDYIRTAKAKGLNKNVIIFKHALKNSLIPVITYLSSLIAGILTGSFVVESIFAIPGMGRAYVTSISTRDYTLILGVTVFYAAFLIICNLAVDIAYMFIDPRVKLQKSN